MAKGLFCQCKESMNNLERKIRKILIVLKFIHPASLLAALKLMFLFVKYYLLELIRGSRRACEIFERSEVILRFGDIKFSVHAVPHDLTFIIECFINGTYEVFNEFIPKNGDVCLDIGANIGACSLRWFKRNRAGKIICCEPHPYTYERLVKNLRLNKCNNVEALQVALSSKEGVIEMSTDEDCSMMVANATSSGKKIISTAEAYTLDSLIARKKIKSIDICKIDVEGHEVEVLNGGEKALLIIQKLVLEYHSPVWREQVKEKLNSLFNVVVVEHSSCDGLIFAVRK